MSNDERKQMLLLEGVLMVGHPLFLVNRKKLIDYFLIKELRENKSLNPFIFRIVVVGIAKGLQ